jgi:DNA modification methylase
MTRVCRGKTILTEEEKRKKLLEKRKKETLKKKMKPSVYDLEMYRKIPRPRKNIEEEFHLEKFQKNLDQIVLADSRDLMEYVSDRVVTLVITSPPYNVGKEYDENFGLEEYLDYLDGTWRECHRVLRPGGRLCINVTGIGRRPYIPIWAHIAKHVVDLGFFMRGEFIWDKGMSVGSSTAWGSWMSATNPTIRDVHEHIMIFSKDSNSLKKNGHPPDISREEFLEYTKSVWTFSTANAKTIGHPAPFPEELPARLIKLYSFPSDLVLDPFAGSGTTCLAAKKSDRHWLGFDIEEEYIDMANKRLEDTN